MTATRNATIALSVAVLAMYLVLAALAGVIG